MAVTDLTGTTWRINSTTCAAGQGQYNLEYQLNDSASCDYLWLGYYYNSFDDMVVQESNIVSTGYYIVTISDGDVISITGGTDATNANLISWMQTNAEQIIEPTANEYTLTQNLTNLTNGNITLTITADEGYSLPAQADIVVTGGTIVSYDDETGELVVTAGTTAVEVECEGTVSTISFSISGTTYQAEDGMTWAQWVDSEYNTGNFQVSGTNIIQGLGIVTPDGNTPVSSSDEIVDNYDYILIVEPV